MRRTLALPDLELPNLYRHLKREGRCVIGQWGDGRWHCFEFMSTSDAVFFRLKTRVIDGACFTGIYGAEAAERWLWKKNHAE